MFQRVENKGKFFFHLGKKVSGLLGSSWRSAPRRCSRRGGGRDDYESRGEKPRNGAMLRSLLEVVLRSETKQQKRERLVFRKAH